MISVILYLETSVPPRVLGPAELMKHVPVADGPALADRWMVAVDPGWNA